MAEGNQKAKTMGPKEHFCRVSTAHWPLYLETSSPHLHWIFFYRNIATVLSLVQLPWWCRLGHHCCLNFAVWWAGLQLRCWALSILILLHGEAGKELKWWRKRWCWSAKLKSHRHCLREFNIVPWTSGFAQSCTSWLPEVGQLQIWISSLNSGEKQALRGEISSHLGLVPEMATSCSVLLLAALLPSMQVELLTWLTTLKQLKLGIAHLLAWACCDDKVSLKLSLCYHRRRPDSKGTLFTHSSVSFLPNTQ